MYKHRVTDFATIFIAPGPSGRRRRGETFDHEELELRGCTAIGFYEDGMFCPVMGYTEMNVDKAKTALGELAELELEQLEAWELAHKARATVLGPISSRLQELRA